MGQEGLKFLKYKHPLKLHFQLIFVSENDFLFVWTIGKYTMCLYYKHGCCQQLLFVFLLNNVCLESSLYIKPCVCVCTLSYKYRTPSKLEIA